MTTLRYIINKKNPKVCWHDLRACLPFGIRPLALIICLLALLTSCTDDLDIQKALDDYESQLPAEILDDYSISFTLTLDNFGVESGVTRDLSSNSDLRDIEGFVDVEKLRILFFSCLDDSDLKNYTDNSGRQYHTGQHDIFLFESRSRWVSELTDAESTTARWQVTAPVFTYGNNDVYQWDYIREALTTRPFKVVILANRPDNVNFGNFDNKFGEGAIVQFRTDRGPNWGPDESALGLEDFTHYKQRNWEQDPTYQVKAPTINGLHHCQWDPIYTSKNNGFGGYNFIMGNPRPEETGTLDFPTDATNDDFNYNLMGAISYWTEKIGDKNYFFHPTKERGIPMYGCQRYRAITNWRKGTPVSLSGDSSGDSNSSSSQTNTDRNNIALIRSVVRLDLLIPEGLVKSLENVELKYANVMSRTEPLDVSTPTDILWQAEITNNMQCEFYSILKYGPIIDQNYGNTSNSTYVPKKNAAELKATFMDRTGWFYGAWKEWWKFSDSDNTWKDSYLHANNGIPHPRLFNPVIQRNGDAYLDYVQINDPGYYHYVVYCGERNINDPSKFENLDLDKTETCYFTFKLNNQQYNIPITDCQKNQNISGYIKGGDMGKYRSSMITDNSSKNTDNWNWPLLRNHQYIFIVTGAGGVNDTDGFDVLTISSEERHAPTIHYY